MNTASASASSALSYSLQHDPEAEDFTLKLDTIIARRRIPGSLERSFTFNVFRFIEEFDDSPDGEELYYYLLESGIDQHDVNDMVVDLVLLACDVTNSVGRDFRGVLTVLLDVSDVSSAEIDFQIQAAAKKKRIRRARNVMKRIRRPRNNLMMNALRRKRF